MNRNKLLLPVLDIAVLIFWGILLLKVWLTSNSDLLLHPESGWLAIAAGFFLLTIGILKIIQLHWSLRQQHWGYNSEMPRVTHVSLLPPVLTSSLLLVVAIVGLFTTPQLVSASKLAGGGVSESLAWKASVSPSSIPATNSANATLLNWVTNLNQNFATETHIGEKVKLKGLVVKETQLPQKYVLISSLVITGDTAKVDSVGLPVTLPENNQKTYTPDTWLEIEGIIANFGLKGEGKLTIEATSIAEINPPENS